MNRYFYDLHLHSCLSPCADNEMTPNSIAGMCTLNGIQIAALTDHNTVKNCPAFFKAAKRYGLIPVAGMELTTAEDIHLICLFEQLDAAMAFGAKVEAHRIRIRNRTDIFGEQLQMDEDDNVIGHEDDLLSNATDLSLEQGFDLAVSSGGVCYPAHVDRQANGLIATLGTFVSTPDFSCAEFHDGGQIEPYCAQYPVLQQKIKLVCSDAHFLWDIREQNQSFMLQDEPYSSALVRQHLFDMLSKR